MLCSLSYIIGYSCRSFKILFLRIFDSRISFFLYIQHMSMCYNYTTSHTQSLRRRLQYRYCSLFLCQFVFVSLPLSLPLPLRIRLDVWTIQQVSTSGKHFHSKFQINYRPTVCPRQWDACMNRSWTLVPVKVKRSNRTKTFTSCCRLFSLSEPLDCDCSHSQKMEFKGKFIFHKIIAEPISVKRNDWKNISQAIIITIHMLLFLSMLCVNVVYTFAWSSVPLIAAYLTIPLIHCNVFINRNRYHQFFADMEDIATKRE